MLRECQGKKFFWKRRNVLEKENIEEYFRKAFYQFFLNSIVNSIPNILKSCIKKGKNEFEPLSNQNVV